MGLCLFAVAACGGRSAPPASPVDPSSPTNGASSPGATAAARCSSDEDCRDQGKALAEEGDHDGALAMYEAGCDAGGGQSCQYWGYAVKPTDPGLAASLWERACEHGNADGCLNAAESQYTSAPEKAAQLYEAGCRSNGGEAASRGYCCKLGSLSAYAQEDYAQARTLAELGCGEELVDACGVLGVLYARGLGVHLDLETAQGYLSKACDGQDEEACQNLAKLGELRETDSLASALPVEDANVSMGSLAVDGLEATDLSCHRESGGGLFGGAMGAISGIAKRSGKLAQCAESPESVRVRWKTAGAKISTVDVKASTPKIESCVKKAIQGAAAAFGGTCAATFAIGR